MWITKVLTDSAGNPSSKRLVGFIAILLMVYLVIFATLNQVKVDLEIWSTVTGIVFWSIGFSGTKPKEKSSPVEVYGCTDKRARNYNKAATVDDGSCEYLAEH